MRIKNSFQMFYLMMFIMLTPVYIITLHKNIIIPIELKILYYPIALLTFLKICYWLYKAIELDEKLGG